MTLNEMRNYIIQQYPNSPGWHYKVSRMPSNQVIAIYHNFLKREVMAVKKRQQEENYHQITLFEYQLELERADPAAVGNHTDILRK